MKRYNDKKCLNNNIRDKIYKIGLKDINTCGSKVGKELKSFLLFVLRNSSVASATTESANSLQKMKFEQKKTRNKILISIQRQCIACETKSYTLHAVQTRRRKETELLHFKLSKRSFNFLTEFPIYVFFVFSPQLWRSEEAIKKSLFNIIIPLLSNI